MQEEEEEERKQKTQTEGGRSSSGEPSPVLPVPLGPRPSADEQSSTRRPVRVEEVGKCSHVNKSGFP